MKKLYLLILACCFLTLGGHAFCQGSGGEEEDRVIAGAHYISALNKILGQSSEIESNDLAAALKSMQLHAIVIQARKADNKTEWFVLVCRGESTKFEKLSVSKKDYDLLLKFAMKPR